VNLIVLILALVVRLYALDSVPYGFHVDEVKAGWNAYSILQTGRDDKGNFLPVYYDSFGDFRPAGLIYLIIPSLLIFGKTIFAVRLPFALFGALTIVPIYFLALEIFKNKKVAILAALLLALNPWHIIASRSTSESVIAVFLTLWGLYFFIKNKSFLTYLFFILSFGFYHNIRVLAPIFLVVIMFFRKPSRQQIVTFILILITSVAIFLSPESRGRMSQVSLKSDFQVLYEVTKMPNEEGPGHVLEARIFHNRVAAYIRRFAEEYKEYFGTDFLLGTIAKPIRYTVPYMGLLTYIEFVLVILGLFWVAKKPELLMIIALLVLSPLPAAITNEDVPNLQRAIFMVPFLMIIMAYGFYGLTKLSAKWKFIFGVVLTVYVLNFVYFCHMYFIHQKMSIATYYRDGGNVELIEKLKEIKSNYNKIILSNSPDDLLPWVNFGFENTSDFDNFVFSKDKCPLQKMMDEKKIVDKNDLFVDAEGCVYDPKLYPRYKIIDVATIHRPDGSPPYYLRQGESVKK